MWRVYQFDERPKRVRQQQMKRNRSSSPYTKCFRFSSNDQIEFNNKNWCSLFTIKTIMRILINFHTLSRLNWILLFITLKKRDSLNLKRKIHSKSCLRKKKLQLCFNVFFILSLSGTFLLLPEMFGNTLKRYLNSSLWMRSGHTVCGWRWARSITMKWLFRGREDVERILDARLRLTTYFLFYCLWTLICKV